MAKNRISIYLSLAAILLSIISICIAAWRSPGLSFDYQGVLVSVLSILVTILIGWNIYTLIDIKSTKDKIEEISSGASFMVQKNLAIAENTTWEIYYYLLLKKDPLGLEYRFLYHGLAGLLYTSKIGNITTCNSIVKCMLECIDAPENIIITKPGKIRLLGFIREIEHADKIERYLELVNRIALIRTN